MYVILRYDAGLKDWVILDPWTQEHRTFCLCANCASRYSVDRATAFIQANLFALDKPGRRFGVAAVPGESASNQMIEPDDITEIRPKSYVPG